MADGRALARAAALGLPLFNGAAAQHALEHVDDVTLAGGRELRVGSVKPHRGEHRVVVLDREEAEGDDGDQQLLGVDRRPWRRRQGAQEARESARHGDARRRPPPSASRPIRRTSAVRSRRKSM